MAAITGDLVDVSRLETGQFRLALAACDLTPLVTEVLDRFRATPTAQRHRLTLIAPSRPIVGQWDAARLEQVFMNLIDNAIKYSPLGGSVEVRLRVIDRDAIVTVRDEGIGIPADKLPQLFHAFYRVESVEERTIPGLGLGLHIVRELVSLHHGTVAVDSEPGRGSTFTVTLPLAAASTETEPTNAPAPEANLADGSPA
jgi:signal transduction histidine kinase